MEISNVTNITMETSVKAPVEKVWLYWTTPEHIRNWNHASEDWHTTKAQNDLRTGGNFLFRMEAKDGSIGFDFEGVYNEIKTNSLLAYTLLDGRKVNIMFINNGNETRIVETFKPESQNPKELQKMGWQAILDNFKKYAEGA